ncbi:MAG: hypothetical protein J5718_00175 [Lachnospiraceae bacterium]|nr:hypothetical protein [Lachnospiraceae bacterium]
MENRTSHKFTITTPMKIFIAIELLLYLLFIGMDITFSDFDFSPNNIFYKISSIRIFSASMLKYYAILLCFAFSLYRYIKTIEKPKGFLTIAMGFTIVSDYFLLLNPEQMIPGLFTFIIAQSVYLYIINGGILQKTVSALGLRIAVAIGIYQIFRFFDIIYYAYSTEMRLTILLGILYAISFLANIIRHIIFLCQTTKAARNGTSCQTPKCMFTFPVLFLIGLILFVLCDINVLICNLHKFVNIYPKDYVTLYYISSVLMWGFYLPSQVIIVLSA